MAGGDFLAALAVLAPPPAGVQPLGESAWAQFEAENGFRPPSDYRAFVDHYGVGGFGFAESTGAWLPMLPPLVPGSTFVEQSAWLRSANIGLQRQFPDLEPDWPMWPAAGGFLQWGSSIDGDQIGWLTVGDPDRWGTAIYGRQMDHLQFPFTCVEFLYRCFTGTLGVEDLAGLVEEGEPRFFPSAPPDPSTVRRPTRQVTVVFAGIGAGGDDRPEPPHQSIFDPGLSMDERAERRDAYTGDLDRSHAAAIAVVDRWVAGLPVDGLTLRSYGRVRTSADEPMHWEISIEFRPETEDVVKDLVVSLAADLRIGIRECRNLEYERVWDDVLRRPR